MANNIADDEDVTPISGEDEPSPVGDGSGSPATGALAGMQQPLEGGGLVPQPGGFHPVANLRAALAARQGIAQPQATVSQQAQQRHGGLLTGLAGVLLDGLSAGAMAQAQAPLYGAPGSNFARGFAMQQQMPLIKQQQHQAMVDSLTAEQKDVYETLHAQVQAMQTRAALQTEGENALMGLTDDQRKILDEDIKDGVTEKVAEGHDYSAMSQQLHTLRNQHGADGIDFWLKPTDLTFDKQGNPSGSHWVIIKDDPNQTLQSARTFKVPDGVDENGETTFRTETAPEGMRVRDYRKFYENEFQKGQARAEAIRDQRAGIGKPVGGSKFMYNDKGEVVGSIDSAGNRRMFTTGAPGAFTMEGLKVAEKTGDDQKNAAATLNSLQRYQGHFQQYSGQLTSGDMEAMKVLTAHQEAVAQNLLDIPLTTINDILTKEPMTGYSQRLMQGTMTKDQYDKMSPQGQQVLADYFHAVVANMYMMRQRMKGMPRNREIIEAEMRNIPLPYLSWQQAQPYFNDTLQDLGSFLGTGGSGTQAPAAQPVTGATGAGVGQTPPSGATMKVPGSDGKMHWSDGKVDLGVIQ